MTTNNLNKDLNNQYWNYRAAYLNENGYKKEHSVTPEIRKELKKMIKIIENMLA